VRLVNPESPSTPPNTKARLYVRAGIVKYWVLDITGRRTIVHRDHRDGRYQSVVANSDQESVVCLATPPSKVRVRDALPESRRNVPAKKKRFQVIRFAILPTAGMPGPEHRN
jgi:hypothetical protein